jgi:Cdc6-like AAA superfamily ATPase
MIPSSRPKQRTTKFTDLRNELISMTTHEKMVLISIVYNTKKDKDMNSWDVYSTYVDICRGLGLILVPQSMVYDIILRLETMDIVRTRMADFGKAGTIREIKLSDWVRLPFMFRRDADDEWE